MASPSTSPESPTTTVRMEASRLHGVGLACLLGVALLALSFARLAGDMNSAAFSFVVVEGALSDSLWKTRLALNLALFFLAMLALHLAFAMACWLLGTASKQAFSRIRCTRRQWILLWFLLGFVWLMLANAHYFPRSSYGEPYHLLASTPVLGVTAFGLATAVVAAGITVVLSATLVRAMQSRTRRYVTAGSVAVALLSIMAWKQASPPAGNDPQRPHIVLLGVDSLRPDVAGTDVAPNVRFFLDEAVHLTDTITPLARTFPAWVSILTGRHPHATGATMNLLPRETIQTGATLPDLLRQQGYRTYYAIDETRFSNIDASYGFDATAMPAMGASDFVLSWFGDTPLSNLVVNTRAGALLFPHLHGNRAAHLVYDPDAFVRRIERSFDFSQPSFLAVHLTLPHWPYAWAASGAALVNESNTETHYLQSVQRADRQFADLLAMLERRGVLDNAIVIALSDHGEALGHAEDFLADAFPGGHEEVNNFQKWGHGTSVFSPAQYQVVLGIRAYGTAAGLLRNAAKVDAPASLIDIAPTILDLLQFKTAESFDGVSLAGLLRAGTNGRALPAPRIRFTETEYNPQGFSPVKMEKDKLALAAKVYRLDSATDRIEVRTDFMESIMANRQYAAFSGRHAGMAIPAEHGYRFIHLPFGDPGTADRTDPDANELKNALQDRFGIQFAPEELPGNAPPPP